MLQGEIVISSVYLMLTNIVNIPSTIHKPHHLPKKRGTKMFLHIPKINIMLKKINNNAFKCLLDRFFRNIIIILYILKIHLIIQGHFLEMTLFFTINDL